MPLELLGPLSAHVEGKTAQLGGRRPRSVLAVLALRAGEVVSVDTLIEHLWGDEPPGDPVNSLPVHVSALRRVLEPGRKGGSEPQLLRNRPPGYLLDVDDDAVDVVRFEALARDGRRHTSGAERPPKPSQSSPRRSHCGADRCSPISPTNGSSHRRRRASVTSGFLLPTRSTMPNWHSAGTARSSHSSSSSLRRIPCASRSGQLLLALYRSGRQADALRAYQRVREVLLDELGVDPGPELRRARTGNPRPRHEADVWACPAESPTRSPSRRRRERCRLGRSSGSRFGCTVARQRSASFSTCSATTPP